MVQINARDWIFEVSTDPSAGTPVWAAVAGLESFDLNKAEGEESTDTTTFSSAGTEESQAMQRGASLALEGKAVRTGSPAVTHNAGQLAAESLAALVGEGSLGGIRFRHTVETNWTVWMAAWVSLGSTGGGKNDKTSWSATFRRSGVATTAAVA